MTEAEEPKPQVSAWRLRLGIIFFVLWWLPVYLAAPTIMVAAGIPNTAQNRRDVLIVIVLLQTAIGIIGLLLAGKQAITLLKGVPKKKMPGKVWHVLVHGDIN